MLYSTDAREEMVEDGLVSLSLYEACISGRSPQWAHGILRSSQIVLSIYLTMFAVFALYIPLIDDGRDVAAP